MSLPQILTLSEVADHLGVATSSVAEWAMDGLLPSCARSESGELAFYRWRVERDGPKLASGEPVRIVKRPDGRYVLLHDGRKLRCGCIISGNGELDRADRRQASWLCPDARMLQTVQQLTELMTAAAPDNVFAGQLARAAAGALTDHLSPANAVVTAQRKTQREARGERAKTDPGKEAA
jgi:hypothetical protein